LNKIRDKCRIVSAWYRGVRRGKVGSRGEGWGKGGGRGKGEEMTQTMYAHMNKIKIKKKRTAMVTPLLSLHFEFFCCLDCINTSYLFS
jgi:hypothetical protein